MRFLLAVTAFAACSSPANQHGDASGSDASTHDFTGSHGMFVLFPAGDGPDSISVQHTLLDSNGPGTTYVQGATLAVPWITIQPTNAPFNWDAIDAQVQRWAGQGKQVALVFQPTSVTELQANKNTPSWWLTPSTIGSISQTGTTLTITVAASTPTTSWTVGSLAAGHQLIQVAGTTLFDGNYAVISADATHITATITATINDGKTATTGTVGNPSYGKPASDGMVNCVNGNLPVPWDPNFVIAWQQVIEAARAHYASSSAIAYMRFGLGVGGETFVTSRFNSMRCRAELDANGYTDATWLSYLESMADFIQAQAFPWTIDLALDQNSFQSPTCTNDNCGGYAATSNLTADYFASKGFAIGTEGIQNDDIANYAAGAACFIGNWCANFDAHPEVPKQFQGRVAPSDPTNTSNMILDQTGVTGSWAALLPFGLARGTQIAEIYWTDWLCTFDQAWTMPMNMHSSGAGSGSGSDEPVLDTYANCNAAGYPAAFTAAAAQIN